MGREQRCSENVVASGNELAEYPSAFQNDSFVALALYRHWWAGASDAADSARRPGAKPMKPAEKKSRADSYESDEALRVCDERGDRLEGRARRTRHRGDHRSAGANHFCERQVLRDLEVFARGIARTGSPHHQLGTPFEDVFSRSLGDNQRAAASGAARSRTVQRMAPSTGSRRPSCRFSTSRRNRDSSWPSPPTSRSRRGSSPSWRKNCACSNCSPIF